MINQHIKSGYRKAALLSIIIALNGYSTFSLLPLKDCSLPPERLLLAAGKSLTYFIEVLI
jgi:hypothetical protein